MDKLTTKFQLALADAQSVAVGRDHQYIEPVHLLMALLDQDGGTARPLLARAGVDISQLRLQLMEALDRMPRVEGIAGEVHVSNDLGKLLRASGASKGAIGEAIDQVRGGERIDDPNAEEQRQALEKFTIDLTERAEQGKLDPVIGRDDEIRRTVQVLQRRTKNNPVLIGEPGVGKTAIVAAATLSHRYITDRQLPDKAIDLIDEAASRIRMEIDSMPEEMDRLDRRIIQLKIEREALKKDSDEASKRRLADLEAELSALQREYSDLEEIWKAEKAALQGTTQVKEEIERIKLEMETARRAGDLARMSELQYGRMPELERRLAQAERAEQQEAVMEIVGQHFRPELINRVDDTVVFHPLQCKQIRRIARLQVDILACRLESRGIQLELTDEALDLLGNIGFDPVYGARPLKRVIQQRLENPLAREILVGRFASGDTIHAETEKGELIFTATR